MPPNLLTRSRIGTPPTGIVPLVPPPTPPRELSRLSVLHTIASMDSEATGTSLSLRRIVQESDLFGCSMTILSIANPAGEPNPRNEGIDLRCYAADFSSLPGLNRLLFSRAFSTTAKGLARQFNVVHNHGLWRMPNVVSATAAGRAGKPLVISPHGMLAEGALRFSRRKKQAFWSLLQRRAAESCTCWHATSEKEAQDIRRKGFTAPVAIVPLGVDAPNDHLAPKCFVNGERVLLFLGRLHPIKGLDSLLRVWSRLSMHFPNWRLDIVGPLDSTDARRYQALVADAKTPRVNFKGALYDEAKSLTYRSADLFVLPTQDENFGIAVAEALMEQTPVICATGAPWSGLHDHGCGWWIEPGDPALESTLRTAMSLERSHLAEMGRRGRAWMRADYAWPMAVERLVQVYRWLSGHAGRPDFVV